MSRTWSPALCPCCMELESVHGCAMSSDAQTIRCYGPEPHYAVPSLAFSHKAESGAAVFRRVVPPADPVRDPEPGPTVETMLAREEREQAAKGQADFESLPERVARLETLLGVA